MTGHWPVPAGLHSILDQAARRGRAACPRRRHRMAQFAAADRGRVAREGRPGQLLHLYLHQLDPPGAVRPRLGRQIRRAGAGRGRGAHPGVRVRARPRERPPGGPGDADRYPVAIDNDYAVWSAFANHYWPALYFADAQGRIRHHHFGEGEYQQSEMVIQQLLAEAGSADPGRELVSVDARGAEAPADWATLDHQRTTPATSAPRTSPPPAARYRASATAMRPRRS